MWLPIYTNMTIAKNTLLFSNTLKILHAPCISDCCNDKIPRWKSIYGGKTVPPPICFIAPEYCNSIFVGRWAASWQSQLQLKVNQKYNEAMNSQNLPPITEFLPHGITTPYPPQRVPPQVGNKLSIASEWGRHFSFKLLHYLPAYDYWLYHLI